MNKEQKRVLLDAMLVVFAALNFGAWMHDFNAGVFVGCALTLLMPRERFAL